MTEVKAERGCPPTADQSAGAAAAGRREGVGRTVGGTAADGVVSSKALDSKGGRSRMREAGLYVGEW